MAEVKSGKIAEIPFASDRRRTLSSLFIAVLIVLTFAPVLQNGFVDFDEKLLVRNSAYRDLGWSGLRWMFFSFSSGQFQPLTWLSFGIDHVLWWSDPFGHHVTNLFLHVVNAELTFLLCLQILRQWRRHGSLLGEPTCVVLAALSALLFALHPLRVEAVAGAFARRELLVTMFFMLSICTYLRAHTTEIDVRQKRRWIVASFIAFVSSTMSGLAGVFVPLVLLMLDVYVLERTKRGSSFPEHVRQLCLEKIPFFFVAATICLATIFARVYGRQEFSADIATATLSLLAAPVFYIWNGAFPIALSPIYDLQIWSLLVNASLGAIIFAALVLARQRAIGAWAAWGCFWILLLPGTLSQDTSPTPQMLADRHTYLASIAGILLLCLAAGKWSKTDFIDRLGRWSKVFASGATIALVTTFAGLSWRQSHVWQNGEILWRNAASANRSSWAQYNLAVLLEAQGKYDEAIQAYRHAAAVEPKRWDAHEKAAHLLRKQGRISDAVEHLKVVVRLHPTAIDARSDLADGLVNQGDIGEAVQHLRKLLDLAPERNHARIKLGTILAVEGRAGEATEVLKAAAKADPADGKNLLRLGQVLAAQGKLPEAVQYFREAARLQPEDAESHESLGRALLELGKKDEAAGHLREALRILRSTPAER